MGRRCKQCTAEMVSYAKSKTFYEKQSLCSQECAVTWGLENAAKEKARRDYFKGMKNKATLERKKKKSLDDMSIGGLKSVLQTDINKLAKIVNKRENCISCGTELKSQAQVDAGHFIAVGQCDAMRFDIRNIHPQCTNCNNHKAGNQIEYERALRSEKGDEFVDYLLEMKRLSKHCRAIWDRPGLMSMIGWVRKELRRHKNRK